jgi:murein DD-endopeptidase MepM/ murein hydrolase activator NlpD
MVDSEEIDTQSYSFLTSQIYKWILHGTRYLLPKLRGLSLLLFFATLLVGTLAGAQVSAHKTGANPGHTVHPTVAAWTVTMQPARLVNGSPVLFRVTTPKTVHGLSGTWLGHDIIFSYDESHQIWFALAGVSQETKPGLYPLDLHADGSPRQKAASSTDQTFSFEKTIRVERQRYPRVQLKVPARYTAPSPEDQHQIEQDKTTKSEAFKTLSPGRDWQGSFEPPVHAEISDVFGVERVFNGSVQSTHQGLDFRVPSGTKVAAVNRGRVILARSLFFEGNCVVIDHGQGLLTLYLHLSKFSVKEGDEVAKGTRDRTQRRHGASDRAALASRGALARGLFESASSIAIKLAVDNYNIYTLSS